MRVWVFSAFPAVLCGPGVLWSSDHLSPQARIWWRGEELPRFLGSGAPMGWRELRRATHAQWCPFSLRTSTVVPGVHTWCHMVGWDASTLNIPGWPQKWSRLGWDCYWLFFVNRVEECHCRRELLAAAGSPPEAACKRESEDEGQVPHWLARTAFSVQNTRC